MAKTFSFSHISLLFVRPRRAPSLPRTLPTLLFQKPSNGVTSLPSLSITFLQSSPFSTAPATPYPLQYELIVHRPTHETERPTTTRCRRGPKSPNSKGTDSTESESDQPESDPSTSELAPELSFEDWVDKKLARKDAERSIGGIPNSEYRALGKAERKYYNKRRKRMYGTDSEDESRSAGDGFVELKPEFAELKTLHRREEELYFYDTFAYPWEKDKHYKMVYQLEKKYFPDQCLDNAFLQPGESSSGRNEAGKMGRERNVPKSGKTDEAGGSGEKGKEEDKGLIFFEEGGVEIHKQPGKDGGGSGSKEISEKKVEEFFKCLKKVPNKNTEFGDSEPFLASRSNGLPPVWDSRGGTVVLINKPKGWTSFTVCGKLRRLVQVKKVGHAGTLDPMATGLLIVCVGKATKIVDRYQGMVKGYTGVFRLGEATSTWDADLPVIQREPWEHIKDEDIKKAAASFTGEIWQVPPMFSAIKVGGERMYDKARRGESIELSPRRISIFQFDIERSLEDRQNLMFRVICTKGTYIRSLCADLGKALGSCAHLTALRRESIGEYSADDAFEFHELEEEIKRGYL